MTLALLKMAVVTLVIIALAGAVVFVLVQDVGKPQLENIGEYPESEYNVTCYKWVENGTARVMCPDRVYAPDSWVNITVKPCSEYVFKIDESRPCGAKP